MYRVRGYFRPSQTYTEFGGNTMKTKTLKTTLAALLALACALGCGTTALAAEEWGVIPDE